MRELIIVMVLLCVSACSTGQLKIESDPKGAQVQLINSDGTIKTLGETPYQEKMSNISKDKSGIVKIKISKDGFSSENYIVENTFLEKEITINLKLERDAAKGDLSVKYETLAKGIALAQGHISAKNYAEAEIQLLSLVKEFPDTSVVYDFLGNLYYLKKNLVQALYYYEKALEIDPNETKRNRIVQKLKVITGNKEL